MTGGQSSLSLGYEEGGNQQEETGIRKLSADRKPLKIIRATDEELAVHEARLQEIDKAAENGCLWLKNPQ